ncbi:hypothetical protein COBT_003600, partial [Conglomerata obtusa]
EQSGFFDKKYFFPSEISYDESNLNMKRYKKDIQPVDTGKLISFSKMTDDNVESAMILDKRYEIGECKPFKNAQNERCTQSYNLYDNLYAKTNKTKKWCNCYVTEKKIKKLIKKYLKKMLKSNSAKH